MKESRNTPDEFEPVELRGSENDSIDRSKSRRRPTAPIDYGQRAIRIKLFFLVSSLLLVLLLMEKVRDPELWRKMGFSERNAAAPDERWIEIELPAGSLETGEDTDNEPELSKTVGRDPDSSQGAAVRKLWKGVFDQLGDVERRMLATAFFGDRATIRNAANLPSLSDILQQTGLRASGQITLEMSRMDSNSRASVLAEELLRSQATWNETIEEAWKNGQLKPVLDASRPSGSAIIDAFRASAWEKVQDKTGPALASDAAAWLLAWHQMLESGSAKGPAPIRCRVFDLMASPDLYRGKRVKVAGRILGVESVESKDNTIGFSRYHVLWVATDTTTSTPLCIYANKLPPGIKGTQNGFTKTDVAMECEAIFFKQRSYFDTENKQQLCPLLITSQFSDEPLTGDTPEVPPANVMPPGGWRGAFVILGLVASLICWLTVRSTTSKFRKPAIPNVPQSLDKLARDNSILSDRERIARFQQEDEL